MRRASRRDKGSKHRCVETNIKRGPSAFSFTNPSRRKASLGKAADLSSIKVKRSASFQAAISQDTVPKEKDVFKRLQKMISDNSFFANMSRQQVDDIARFMKLRSYSKGDKVYTKGVRGVLNFVFGRIA